MKGWLVSNKNNIFWGTLAILALILSFGLGYFTGQKENRRAPIIIERCSGVADANR